MSGVSRLPGNYIQKKNYKNSNSLPDNIEQELKRFHEEYLHGSDEISIGYADIGAILVRTFNTGAWTKREHEIFCQQFNIILSSFDRCEHYEPRRYTFV